jgi:hypothetical protein
MKHLVPLIPRNRRRVVHLILATLFEKIRYLSLLWDMQCFDLKRITKVYGSFTAIFYGIRLLVWPWLSTLEMMWLVSELVR